MKDKKSSLIIGLATMVVSALLAGCAGSENKEQPEASVASPAPAVAAAPAPVATTDPKDLPDEIEGEVLVIPAKVKAINKKTRELTLVSPDGKLAKIKCGPDVRDFEQIRVGDEVKTTLLESVEVLVTEAAQQTGEQVTEVNRAPVGSKPSFEVVDAVEINALILAIDYKTREMTLKEPDGRVLKMKAGPDVEHLDKIKVGDSVVTRFTEALSIEVSKAKAGSKAKAKTKKK